ncbi:hypothetical protein MKW98_012837 [Papaver atlanticum]|uniref:Uncharacterized protein n=1 Tax=Papaver atlanticum TaxID=357466 RepID=A0AAD4XGV1_9MAGN|nr:hypothetical protein MKW98_012837 [Papaver atlanticum]
MAPKTSLSLVSFFLLGLTLIAFQPMNIVDALNWGTVDDTPCFTAGDILNPRISCAGNLMTWRYSPTDDVRGDCMGWCESVKDIAGVACAQMNEDENYMIYCACYDTCVIH